MKTIINNFRNNAFFTIISIMILLTLGCEKDLEIDLPNSQLTGTSVFQEEGTARAALNQVYADIRDNSPLTGTSSGINVLLGMYADELKYYGEGGSGVETFYIHNVQPNNSEIQAWWAGAYSTIYECNAVLEGLTASPLPEEVKGPLKGEALFLRAFLHFYLTNLFGDIPYITTTDYRVNSKIERNSIEDVYAAIITDLIQAEELLLETEASGQKIYATKATANTLLSRVYLYQNEWQKSAEAATTVLENTYALANLNEVFVSNGTGIIWQLPPIKGSVTYEARTFIFEIGPPPFVALQPEFITSFETNDKRKNSWIGTVSDGTQTWFFPYKYKSMTEGSGSEEFSVMMRLAEVFLIRAEARAHLGDIGGAQADINQIRQRAGLANTTANTENELVMAILQERRHEFFTEQGHRWFDLKRNDLAASTLKTIKSNWKDSDRLFPLPQQELTLNPNLQPQNPGY